MGQQQSIEEQREVLGVLDREGALNVMFPESKPVVNYRASWRQSVELGHGAMIFGVTNHPRLGDVGEKAVYTSNVINVTEMRAGLVTEFETLNTVYRSELPH